MCVFLPIQINSPILVDEFSASYFFGTARVQHGPRPSDLDLLQAVEPR